MQIRYEYAATTAEFISMNGVPNAPIPPPGAGWRMTGVILLERSESIGPVWYWEREAPVRTPRARKTKT